MSEPKPIGVFCDCEVYVRGPDDPWPRDTTALVIPDGPLSMEILRDAISRYRANYPACRIAWITTAQYTQLFHQLEAVLDPPVELPPNVIDMRAHRKR